MLWANLHLLFWLSLVPFLTAWTGETGFAALPMAFYGGALLLAGVAFAVLERALQTIPGANPVLHAALGASRGKEVASVAAYLAAVPVALAVYPYAAGAIYAAVAAMWLVPDRRIEAVLTREHVGRA